MTPTQKATFQFWRDEVKKAFKAFVADRTEANKRIYEFAVQKRNEAIYNWQEETVATIDEQIFKEQCNSLN